MDKVPIDVDRVSSQDLINSLLSVPFRFWTCPKCISPRIAWMGNKATCESCGRSNGDAILNLDAANAGGGSRKQT